MSAYGNFSAVYDLLMSDFNYKDAAEYLVELAKKHGGLLKKPLDLACGSGRLAAELAELGFDPFVLTAHPKYFLLPNQDCLKIPLFYVRI